MAALKVMDELTLPATVFGSATVNRWSLLIAGTGFGLYMLWRHIWILDAAEALRRKQKRLFKTQQSAASAAAGLADPKLLACLYDTLPSPTQHSLCALDRSFLVRSGTSVTPIGDFETSTQDDPVVQWTKSQGLIVKYLCQRANQTPGELRLLSSNVVEFAVSRGWVGSAAASVGCVAISKRVGVEAITVSARSIQDLGQFATVAKPKSRIRIGFCSGQLMEKMRSDAVEGILISEEVMQRVKSTGKQFAVLREKWEIERRSDILAERESLRIPWMPDLVRLISTYISHFLSAIHVCDPFPTSAELAISQWNSAISGFLDECRKNGLCALCGVFDLSDCGSLLVEAGLTLTEFSHPSAGLVTALGRESACYCLLETLTAGCI